MATAILCQSASLRRSLINEGVAAPGRLLVPLGGSNGVDTAVRFNPDAVDQTRVEAIRQRLGLQADTPVLLFIGRLVGDKGIRELVAAWRRLELEVPALRLVLVGPFEERDSLDASTRDYLSTHPRISLVGLDWDVAPYLALATMLVLPTYREGFPNVLLEAASMRVPVVATRVDGCVDAVDDGVTGDLVPPRDADALHDAILYGLQNPEVLRARGIAARERATRSFERSTMQHAMVDIYDHLLGIRSRTQPSVIPQPALDAWTTGPLALRDLPGLPRHRSSGDPA
jgi:glycosyltransferase involved in cell wall biosynthesis